MTTPEERLTKLEADVKVVATVASAAVDDTLRVCLVIQELSDGGYLPELPWDLATALVDLQHAKQAQAHGTVAKGPPIEVRITELELRVRELRAAFRRRADEQLDPG